MHLLMVHVVAGAVQSALVPRARDVVFSLVRGADLQQGLEILRARAECLADALLDVRYDTVFFHEGDLPGNASELLQGAILVDAREYGGFDIPDALTGECLQSVHALQGLCGVDLRRHTGRSAMSSMDDSYSLFPLARTNS